MYDLANQLSLDVLGEVARHCYRECLESGYTAIGEFHYLHHDEQGQPHDDPVAAARTLMQAAKAVGIRQTLLWTVYARGGFDQPLQERQRRFRVKDLEQVEAAIEALQDEVIEGVVEVGVGIHSVRAVPPGWMGPIAELCDTLDLVLHAHVSEQRAEVEQCIAETGLSPVALLHREGVLGPRFTAVHATWLSEDDIALLRAAGATVCLCPSTEGDLGDGVPQTGALHRAGVPLCIGSDSHVMIDPFTELRMAEYQARAALEQRCVLTDPSGAVAPALQALGSQNGYRALGLNAHGDQVTLRQDARALELGGAPEEIAMLSAHPGLIDEVHVNGALVVRGGRHVGASS